MSKALKFSLLCCLVLSAFTCGVLIASILFPAWHTPLMNNGTALDYVGMSLRWAQKRHHWGSPNPPGSDTLSLMNPVKDGTFLQ
ncbi:hypothetical protein [Pantoea sp.]|uniref:hypothetical protein n=1 Tax=Pantoea sp. TaxID=69393 RepID=UPI0028A6438B|nr:hypothetical protein [Pantoea sp.]